MTTLLDAFARMSDEALLDEVKAAAQHERKASAQLIALLAEVDQRRLYLGEGCASLLTYCTQVLHLSEHAAYGRIEAARAARRFPVILTLLADGVITLTTVTLLAPALTADNHARVLEQSRHRSKRDVERLLAELRPLPDVPSAVRRVASRSTGVTPPEIATLASVGPAHMLSSTDDHDVPMPFATVPVVITPDAESQHATPTLKPSPPAVVAPLAPQRYRLQCTISEATHDTLRQVQALLRHDIPTGDLGPIIDRALTLLLADLERNKCATTERPRASQAVTSGRHIPASVRRAVWKRDGGQCAFFGAAGRCTERGFLEFHHVEPYAIGGLATVSNISLRCRAHNLHEADQYFGERLPLLIRESRLACASTRSGPGS